MTHRTHDAKEAISAGGALLALMLAALSWDCIRHRNRSGYLRRVRLRDVIKERSTKMNQAGRGEEESNDGRAERGAWIRLYGGAAVAATLASLDVLAALQNAPVLLIVAPAALLAAYAVFLIGVRWREARWAALTTEHAASLVRVADRRRELLCRGILVADEHGRNEVVVPTKVEAGLARSAQTVAGELLPRVSFRPLWRLSTVRIRGDDAPTIGGPTPVRFWAWVWDWMSSPWEEDRPE